MFRITAAIILSLSYSYLNDAQQISENRTIFDLNSAVFCDEPRRCLHYSQCQSDNTFNVQGIGILNSRFDSGSSNTIKHGIEVYTMTVNKTIVTRSGEEKAVCQFYERCCGETSITESVAVVPASATIITRCGFSNPEGIGFSVTNPGKAQFGEYPWLMAVMWKHPDVKTPELAGGGSLINRNVILTAAHILAASKPSEFKVRAGEWDTQSESETLRHQERNVKEIIIHEYFHNLYLENDYALLVVDQPFVLDQHIQPICLPTSNLDFDYINCYAAGWGKTDFLQLENRQSVMKKVEIPVVPFEMCQNTLRKTQLGDIFKLHDSFICAGGVFGKDTCTGDGGSPLMCPVYSQPNRYYQAGIVAWGVGCGLDGIPGVYANVALVREWIDRKILGLGYGSDSYSIS